MENLIGRRAHGLLHLNNLYTLVQTTGHKWALCAVDENQVITDVITEGARAKVARVTAVQTGMLPYFWYECITQLQIEAIRVTPVQATQIWKLTYTQMVELNRQLCAYGKDGLARFLAKVA